MTFRLPTTVLTTSPLSLYVPGAHEAPFILQASVRSVDIEKELDSQGWHFPGAFVESEELIEERPLASPGQLSSLKAR